MADAQKRPMFTISEASAASGVHRNTIRRYLERERFPNATQVRESGQDVWRIPLEDLLSAGLKLHAPTPPLPPAPPAESGDEVMNATISAEVAELRRELAERDSELENLRRQLYRATVDLDTARQIADERARTIDLLSAVTRALNVAATPPPKRRWWQRGDGPAQPEPELPT